MLQKKLHVDGIGDVTLKQNSRARNITLRLIPGPELIISAPRLLSEKKALSIIKDKQSWILSKLNSSQFQIQQFRDGDVISSLHFDIIILQENSIPEKRIKKVVPLRVKGNIELTETQESIWTQLRELLRKEAKAYLPQRVAWIANQFGFNYNRVSVKDTKTRWGSCSMKKNINLSLYLMRLPENLIDYIILHELCHTVHMNHGDEFHRLMDELTHNEEKAMRKELRNYRTGI